MLKQMKQIRNIIMAWLLCVVPMASFAQLKKTATIEKLKSFTNGSVTLTKTMTEKGDTYSVILRNNSKFHDPVIFLLGDKETTIKNLQDFSEALKNAKKGEHFDFEVMGQTYSLAYSTTLGQKCFKVWEPNGISSDFGRLYKATIDDMIKCFMEQ